jgi:hypothetical protein
MLLKSFLRAQRWVAEIQENPVGDGKRVKTSAQLVFEGLTCFMGPGSRACALIIGDAEGEDWYSVPTEMFVSCGELFMHWTGARSVLVCRVDHGAMRLVRVCRPDVAKKRPPWLEFDMGNVAMRLW